MILCGLLEDLLIALKDRCYKQCIDKRFVNRTMYFCLIVMPSLRLYELISSGYKYLNVADIVGV